MCLSQELIEMVKRHEAFTSRAFWDNGEGAPRRNGQYTNGWGTKAGFRGEKINGAEAYRRLLVELRECTNEYSLLFHQLDLEGSSLARKDALIDMLFNMGLPNFMGFKKMLACIFQRDWDGAAREALDSKWRKQVGYRAGEIAGMLKSGQYCGPERELQNRGAIAPQTDKEK